MSTVFQIRCDTCDVVGPMIRRTAGMRAVLHAEDLPATPEGKRLGEYEWGEFLAEHEFCRLRLVIGP